MKKTELIQYKLAIEKQIFQINDKLSQFVSKIISSNTTLSSPKNEEEIMEKTKDFVRYLLSNNEMRTEILWTKNNLLFNIIKKIGKQ